MEEKLIRIYHAIDNFDNNYKIHFGDYRITQRMWLKILHRIVEVDNVEAFHAISDFNLKYIFVDLINSNKVECYLDFIIRHQLYSEILFLSKEIFNYCIPYLQANMDYDILLMKYLENGKDINTVITHIINNISDLNICPELFYKLASMYTDIKVFQLALSMGYQIESNNGEHLYMAFQTNNHGLVKLFLGNGLNIDIIDINRKEFIDYVLDFPIGLKILIDHGFNLNLLGAIKPLLDYFDNEKDLKAEVRDITRQTMDIMDDKCVDWRQMCQLFITHITKENIKEFYL